MKIFQRKDGNGKLLLKIGACMVQVFAGAEGREIYRECTTYDPNPNPLRPKLTLNKIRVWILPEVRSWLRIKVSDQRGPLEARVNYGTLDFASRGKINILITNQKNRTTQELAAQWVWRDGAQCFDLFQGPEKAQDQPVTAKMAEIIPALEESLSFKSTNGNGKSKKRTRDAAKDSDEPKNRSLKANKRSNRLTKEQIADAQDQPTA